MDDRRFDSLVKALAEGRNRRSVLKGLLGLGGAAVVGSTLREEDARAARRPTPTPTPVKCPGQQTPVGNTCQCVEPKAPGPHICGPSCCTGLPTVPHPAPLGHTECCDQACCLGTCYGEELCCPTNYRSTGEFPIPPSHKICDTVSGPECCLNDDDCCIVDGCCSTVCFGGSVGADSCCPVEDFCPGGPETEDICCLGNTTCCHGGTDRRACVDLTVEGNCCVRGDCEDPFCQVCNEETHTCGPLCDEATEVCCTEQAGSGVCVTGTCCPGAPCGEPGNICCAGATAEDPSVCIDPAEQCCTTADCQPADSGPGCEVECYLEEHVCRSLICLEGQICCRDDAGFGTCVDGRICPCVDNADCPDCQVCAQGTCVPGSGGESCVVFADDDDEDTGFCCDGQCLPANQVCNGGTCCPGGFCDGNGDCCPAGNEGCNGGTCCSTFCDINGDCCESGIGCNGGVCCSVECDGDGNCPDQTCEPNCLCGDGVVDPATDGLVCNGGGGVCACGWCVVPLEGCPCGCAGDTECIRCAGGGICELYNQGGDCNGGDGTCQGEWCLPPLVCEDFCCSLQDCIDQSAGDDECMQCVGGECVPANPGASCNGGAGACTEGWCV